MIILLPIALYLAWYFGRAIGRQETSDWLEKYGQHLVTCPWWTTGTEESCTCGFGKALGKSLG